MRSPLNAKKTCVESTNSPTLDTPRFRYTMRSTTLLVCVAVFCLLGLSSRTSAQSSLFNIPTTDTLGRGETYIEADFDANLAQVREDRWQSFGAMAVRGISKRFEVGVNGYAVRSASGFEPVEIQPNVKWKVYENEENGFSLAAGIIGYLPLSKRFHRIANLSVYAVASKQFSVARAPRVTGGAYQLLGATPDKSDSRGVMIGVEQPIFKRTTFLADWRSGKNRFGYAAAGFGVAVTKRSGIYTAYYFGNEGRGNNFLGVYYSRTF